MRPYVAAFAALTLAGLAGPAAIVEADTSNAHRPPTTLTVVGQIGVGSPEADALQAEFDAYAAERNVEIVYEQSGGLAELQARIDGPNPPDLVLLPQPSALVELAPDLVDLSKYVKEHKLRRDYGDFLIDQVTVDGAVVGAPVKGALKSLVWYQPEVFEMYGYQVPETFTELIALSDTMVANGQWPWCAFMESGDATGWMGTDWVEDLLLTTEGPEVYDQWIDHDVLFVDPPVEAAFERFQQIMDTPGYVFARTLVLDVFFWFNAYPLGDSECLMHKQASFFAAAITDAGYDLGDFATFEFPPVDPAYADAAMGGGDYVAAITDSVEVRQLVKFMASPRFGKAAIAGSETGWILPNTRFQTWRYTDEMTGSFAETVQAALAADQFRFDASDLMPPEVGSDSFWAGIRNLLNDDRTLQEVLADIDASWPT